MITLSETAKILSQMDVERDDLDKESVQLMVEINHILSEAFEKVKKLGLRQEASMQRRIGLEQLAFRTITMNLEK